ncbi:MAG: chromosomal replication initiator protein DnaA [Chloroflexi bacterium]|nr:chromosomal replication initiator protein DnaA [Chloroflexota bacterium]
MNITSPQQVWSVALGSLQVQVSPTNYETWLKNTVGLSYDSGLFVVGVPHGFAAEWLQKRLHSLVRRTLIDITGHDLDVEFSVANAPHISTSRVVPPAPVESSEIIVPSNPLNARYTFDAFIVGDSNRLAYTAARELCDKPGHGYNPLFIYGGPGLGKTHLIQAIGHTCQTKKLSYAYVSAEKFTNEYIEAVQERQTRDFRQRYRDVDILLVDDLNFLCGKERTEETFFHTFNDLHNANHQIVVTCDNPPRDMPLIKERLRSRLEWGLVVNIQPPEQRTRMAILTSRARQIDADVPEEVLELICQRAGPSVRELEGCLNQVVATVRVSGGGLDLEAASRALSGASNGEEAISCLPVQRMLALVAENFDVDPEALAGRQRSPQVAQARQVAILILRDVGRRPLTEIGRLLGNRDHSTIIYGYKKVLHDMEHDVQLSEIVMRIRENLHISD